MCCEKNRNIILHYCWEPFRGLPQRTPFRMFLSIVFVRPVTCGQNRALVPTLFQEVVLRDQNTHGAVVKLGGMILRELSVVLCRSRTSSKKKTVSSERTVVVRRSVDGHGLRSRAQRGCACVQCSSRARLLVACSRSGKSDLEVLCMF